MTHSPGRTKGTKGGNRTWHHSSSSTIVSFQKVVAMDRATALCNYVEDNYPALLARARRYSREHAHTLLSQAVTKGLRKVRTTPITSPQGWFSTMFYNELRSLRKAQYRQRSKLSHIEVTSL